MAVPFRGPTVDHLPPSVDYPLLPQVSHQLSAWGLFFSSCLATLQNPLSDKFLICPQHMSTASQPHLSDIISKQLHSHCPFNMPSSLYILVTGHDDIKTWHKLVQVHYFIATCCCSLLCIFLLRLLCPLTLNHVTSCAHVFMTLLQVGWYLPGKPLPVGRVKEELDKKKIETQKTVFFSKWAFRVCLLSIQGLLTLPLILSHSEVTVALPNCGVIKYYRI